MEHKTNILTTDLLVAQFGVINFEIIKHGKNRTTLIRDSNNDVKLIAVVTFYDGISKKLSEIHQTIENGALIGKTIRNCGYDITRITICNFSVELENIFNEEPSFVKGQLYQLHVEIDNKKEKYCEICEIYAAEYQFNISPISPNPENFLKLNKKLKESKLKFRKLKILL